VEASQLSTEVNSDSGAEIETAQKIRDFLRSFCIQEIYPGIMAVGKNVTHRASKNQKVQQLSTNELQQVQ